MNPTDLEKLLTQRNGFETRLNGFEVWLLIFGAFVVIGVAGESLYGIRTWWNNRKLREVNLQIEKYRESETALFNQKAGEALERAATAEQHLAEANEGAAQANERAANAQKEAAKSNEAAERERLARLQLEARLADRVLTSEQVDKLKKSLSAFPPQTAAIVVFGNSVEIMSIAQQLSATLIAVGWTLHSGTTSMAAVRGIVVATDNSFDSTTGQAATTLVSGLTSAGITCVIAPAARAQFPAMLMMSNIDMKEPIRIFIGNKP